MCRQKYVTQPINIIQSITTTNSRKVIVCYVGLILKLLTFAKKMHQFKFYKLLISNYLHKRGKKTIKFYLVVSNVLVPLPYRKQQTSSF